MRKRWASFNFPFLSHFFLTFNLKAPRNANDVRWIYVEDWSVLRKSFHAMIFHLKVSSIEEWVRGNEKSLKQKILSRECLFKDYQCMSIMTFSFLVLTIFQFAVNSNFSLVQELRLNDSQFYKCENENSWKITINTCLFI